MGEPKIFHRAVDRLLALPDEEITRIVPTLPPPVAAKPIERLDELKAQSRALGPVAWVKSSLEETLYSKQQEILEALVTYDRVAVPSCHGSGKSHIAARAIGWFIESHEPGTAVAITTSTTFRQVEKILWPQIRTMHTRHNLAGKTNKTEWLIDGIPVAWGFKSEENRPEALQGVHAPHLLIVVDEAGGISDEMGKAMTGLLTGSDTTILAIGNPSIASDDTWFTRACNSPLWHVIEIPASATPNFTGEEVGLCKACPARVPAHTFAKHMVDKDWVEDVAAEFGVDDPYYVARVNAVFPTLIANRLIPMTWLEEAAKNESPAPGFKVRLGIDPAADGGDEFVIARWEGNVGRIVHHASGAANENSTDVAGICLEQILEAEKIQKRLWEAADPATRGTLPRVQVKIDEIGIGWAVAGTLKQWGKEGRHKCRVVRVKVSRSARDKAKHANQRAEMWAAMRDAVEPNPDGSIDVRLDVDRATLAQLVSARKMYSLSGAMQLERKEDMRRRGQRSPDRAEALILGWFEPRNAGPLLVA